MKYSSIPVSEKLQNNGNISRERHVNMGKLVPFLFTSLGLATIFSFFLLYSPFPSQFTPKQGFDSLQNQRHPNQNDDHRNVLPKPQDHRDQEQNVVQPKPQRSKISEQPQFLFFSNSACVLPFLLAKIMCFVFGFCRGRQVWLVYRKMGSRFETVSVHKFKLCHDSRLEELFQKWEGGH